MHRVSLGCRALGTRLRAWWRRLTSTNSSLALEFEHLFNRLLDDRRDCRGVHFEIAVLRLRLLRRARSHRTLWKVHPVTQSRGGITATVPVVLSWMWRIAGCQNALS